MEEEKPDLKPAYPKCTQALAHAGKPYPKSCEECGDGVCLSQWADIRVAELFHDKQQG